MEIPAVPRAVLHALELAQEDLTFWCGDLSEPELMATPSGLPSIAFHLRHIARSLGRLLTYAEGRQLNERQRQALTGEADSQCLKTEIFSELSAALADSSARILKLGEQADTLNQPRIVGRKNLPTTVAGLLVHIADHTQRHVGQAITTAKILVARRGSAL
ncbi:MAG TPA: DinB family protein [Candidatus Acidoferrum sp.]|nr:DinB family protein [Candidatus Acidoferrum sp.]